MHELAVRPQFAAAVIPVIADVRRRPQAFGSYWRFGGMCVVLFYALGVSENVHLDFISGHLLFHIGL